jgi:hypothetical protein
MRLVHSIRGALGHPICPSAQQPSESQRRHQPIEHPTAWVEAAVLLEHLQPV